MPMIPYLLPTAVTTAIPSHASQIKQSDHLPSRIRLPFSLLTFCWFNFISRLIFLLRTTCSRTSLFLASTPSLKSGNFCLQRTLRGLRSSMNLRRSRSKGAVFSYYFRNTFSSFLKNWFWTMCSLTRQLSDSTFLRVSGILKLVLWRLVRFFEACLPSSCRPTISPSAKLSFLRVPSSSTRFSMSWEQTRRSFCRICFTFGMRRIYYLSEVNFGSERYFSREGTGSFLWVGGSAEGRTVLSEKFIMRHYSKIYIFQQNRGWSRGELLNR